ncbi:MAG: hypothetical protein LUH21_04450 [Clostridiales bacterium]|nr:hypothetical protein [Clostridiales bacterium]
MDFKELTGEHLFSGFDCVPHVKNDNESKWDDYGDDCLVCIDGINYLIIEDLCDGWRSHMTEPVITTRKIKNTFPEQRVIIKYRTESNDWEGEDDDVVEIYSMTGELILEIGTANISDWYPSAVHNFMPENMEINK